MFFVVSLCYLDDIYLMNLRDFYICEKNGKKINNDKKIYLSENLKML